MTKKLKTIDHDVPAGTTNIDLAYEGSVLVEPRPVLTPDGHQVWEYAILHPGRPADMEAQILQLGLLGWRFVQAVPNIGHVILERPKMEKQS